MLGMAAARPKSHSRIQPAVGLPGCLIVLIAIVFSCHSWRIMVANYTLWIDEAMLVSSISAVSWRDVLSPLPYYDQAAPLLYVFIIKCMSGVFGISEPMLRLPALLAAAGSVALVATLPRLTPLERCIAAVALTGSFVFARTLSDVKQYTFEVLSTCLLIRCFDIGFLSSPRRFAVAFVALLMASVAASCFPIVAVAVAGGFAFQALRRGNVLTAHVRGNAMVIALFTFGFVLYLIYYINYVLPSYQFVIKNFSYAYDRIGYNSNAEFYPVWFIRRLSSIVQSHYGETSLLIGFLSCFGLAVLALRREAYLAQIVLALSVMVVLNLAGVFPIVEDRFTLFLVPWVAMLIAAGASEVLGLIKPAMLRAVACLAMTAALLWPATGFIANPHNQQARLSLAQLRADAATPVVVMLSAQPVYDVYLGSAGHERERACVLTGVLGFTNRCSRLKATADGIFEGASTKWYLMNYIAIAGWGDDAYGFPGKSFAAFSDDYYDWLAARIVAAGRCYIFTVQHTKADIAKLVDRVAKSGTVTTVADERTAQGGGGKGAAVLLVFNRSRS